MLHLIHIDGRTEKKTVRIHIFSVIFHTAMQRDENHLFIFYDDIAIFDFDCLIKIFLN